jgi:hypothetical protein
MTIPQLPDLGDLLANAIERIASVLAPQSPPRNRQQRRAAQFGQRGSKRQRALMASKRLVGKGQTGRPVHRK